MTTASTKTLNVFPTAAPTGCWRNLLSTVGGFGGSSGSSIKCHRLTERHGLYSLWTSRRASRQWLIAVIRPPKVLPKVSSPAERCPYRRQLLQQQAAEAPRLSQVPLQGRVQPPFLRAVCGKPLTARNRRVRSSARLGPVASSENLPLPLKDPKKR
eukprot:symbB.v1.2.006415.t1/scaffold381.1/size215981/4